MARDARKRKVPEPEPSALAHRALRARLAVGRGPRGVAGAGRGRSRRSSRQPPDDRAAGRTRSRAAGRPCTPRTRPRPIDRRPPTSARRSTAASGPTPCSGCSEAEPSPDLAAAVARADRSRPPQPARAARPAGRLLEKAVAAARRRARHAAAGRGRVAWPKSTASACDGPTTPGRSCATGWSSSGSSSARPTPKGGSPWPALYERPGAGPRHGGRVAA